MNDKPSEECGTFAGQSECYCRAKRVSDHPRRRESQIINQRCEVGDILSDAALPVWTLTIAMAAPIIGQNSKRLGQMGNNEIPGMTRRPRPVHEDERDSSSAAQLIKELDAVNVRGWHARFFRSWRRSTTSLSKNRSGDATIRITVAQGPNGRSARRSWTNLRAF